MDWDLSLTNLSSLAAAAEDADEQGPYADFVKASAEKTNVGEQRRKRFVWMSKALEPQLL